jgi:deoxycytidylate deaminase
VAKTELVIGFVGPVGVDSGKFQQAAMMRLKAYGYTPELIRLSQRLDDLKTQGLLKTRLDAAPEFERVLSHMDAGDELRGRDMRGAQGLLAAAAIAAIAGTREKNDKQQTKPAPSRAWLISSLKNPAEVEVFRRVYGVGFFLVGLFATESERRKALLRGMSLAQADELIRRDAKGVENHGQQTRLTFELADVWVNDEDQLCRFLDLVFGDTLQTPTSDEDGMALAYVSALRSSDLSRQVGAAIVSVRGDVIGTGRNEVPAPGGGQYSPPTEQEPTARDCDVGYESNLRVRQSIEAEIAGCIEAAVRTEFAELCAQLDDVVSAKLVQKLDSVRGLVLEKLPTTRLRDITEYGRAVHAEMSALLAAARVGASVRGATLFCTTFPCHNCAKHLAAAGIARVVFVEPYPKSMAADLHADAIALAGETGPKQLSDLTAKLATSRTKFEPFLGVGPRRYFDLFSLRLGMGRPMDRRTKNGDVLRFVPTEASPRVNLATTTYLEEEIEAAGILDDLRMAQREEQRHDDPVLEVRERTRGVEEQDS